MKTLIGNVLFGFDADVSAWVAQRIPGFTPTKDARALGVVRDERLIAGVVYERWNGVHVEASIAVDHPGWATKDTMFRIFSYPFNQLGCVAISVIVPSSNIQSLNLATKMGFEPEALVKYAAHDGSSLVIMKMFKENCRWIGNGKRRRSTRGTGSV